MRILRALVIWLLLLPLMLLAGATFFLVAVIKLLEERKELR